MSRSYNRRDFLQLGTVALGALAFSRLDCGKQGRKLEKIGLQLYSVKDVFEKDPVGTMRLLAGMGYTQLESYERNGDFFWGLTNKDFKKVMDELGMSLISTHCEIEKNFEQKAEQAAEIGMKYLIYNWPFSQQPMDEYKRKADLFNHCGEICKKAGLRFSYHNYSSSYQLVDGIYPQDMLMERTDASLVYHQMDIYWLVRAGQDPKAWLKKYPGRYKLSHVKDGNNKETCVLGKGNIDLSSILSVGLDNGMEYFIVEQEHFQELNSMESAGVNAEYLKGLVLL